MSETAPLSAATDYERDCSERLHCSDVSYVEPILFANLQAISGACRVDPVQVGANLSKDCGLLVIVASEQPSGDIAGFIRGEGEASRRQCHYSR